MFRTVFVAIGCAAAIAAAAFVSEPITLAILTGLVSGLLASLVFYMVLFDLQPRILISPVAAFGLTRRGDRKLSIKIINKTGFDIIEPFAALHAVEKVIRGAGTRHISRKITLANDRPLVVRKRRARSRRNPHIFIFTAKIDDAVQERLDASSFLRFRLVTEHPVSGVKRVFHKTYRLNSEEVCEGRFKSGENFDLEAEIDDTYAEDIYQTDFDE